MAQRLIGAWNDLFPLSTSQLHMDWRRRQRTRYLFDSIRIPIAKFIRPRRQTPNGMILAVNQTYSEFGDADERPLEVLGLVREDKAIEFGTFSAASNLVGIRVGWGKLKGNIRHKFGKVLNPINISADSQLGGSAEYSPKERQRTRACRNRLCAASSNFPGQQ